MKIASGDEVTIAGDELRPPTGDIIDDAFELLVAIRLASDGNPSSWESRVEITNSFDVPVNSADWKSGPELTAMIEVFQMTML